MMTNAPQVDVSTTRASPDWRPITVISSDVAAELTKLKQQPGKTSVGASGTLVRFLLTEGLLDELNLLVHPVVVGTGMRLFDEVTRQVDLTLIEARTFSTGVLAVSYLDRCARLWRGEAPGIELLPRPHQAGGPPLWIAGQGARMVRLAGQRFDGWLPVSPTVGDYRSGLRAAHQAAEQAGRDPSTITASAYLTVAIADTPQQAAAELTAYLGATEVGVTAAATRFGSAGSAGPLLALWGVGSLAGGLAATRRGGSARTAGGLALILATLALGHAALGAQPREGSGSGPVAGIGLHPQPDCFPSHRRTPGSPRSNRRHHHQRGHRRKETAMMPYTTTQALGQARLAELHDQARRDALAGAARRDRRQDTIHRAPRLLVSRFRDSAPPIA